MDEDDKKTADAVTEDASKTDVVDTPTDTPKDDAGKDTTDYKAEYDRMTAYVKKVNDEAKGYREKLQATETQLTQAQAKQAELEAAQVQKDFLIAVAPALSISPDAAYKLFDSTKHIKEDGSVDSDKFFADYSFAGKTKTVTHTAHNVPNSKPEEQSLSWEERVKADREKRRG